MSDYQDIMDKGLTLVEFYRKNPVIAASDLLRIDLDVPQRAVFEDMWFKNFVVITAGRGTGKTYLSAAMACLWAMLYPGQKVGLLAPSFRQSKTIFAEVEKIWAQSPCLQEATMRRPIRQSDRCLLEFRQAGSKPPSLIEGQPLGDGSKIRGARYYLIIADEFAQIPEDIFNTVIVPMAATKASPMQNVRRVQMKRDLIERGLATEADFKDDPDQANKIVMTSSAFFQFNHMYETITSYEELIQKGSNKHAIHSFTYRDMSEGFLDEENIRTARVRLSDIEFRMEYLAEWLSDSSGIFKASLINKCKTASSHTVKLSGDPGKEYILGVDPARTSDAFALCMIEIGAIHKVVGAWEYYGMVFPKMSDLVMDLCNRYNVIALHMDSGGGGLAIKDLIGEEARYGTSRLLDVDDEETQHLEGRRILHMANFSPKWIAEANYGSLNLMEKDHLHFPRNPQVIHTGDAKILEEKEEVYETVEKMLRQMLLISVSENRSGVAHFDVPSGGGHAAQKKDLYTSFILAAKQAYDMTIAEEEGDTILHIGLTEDRRAVIGPPAKSLADSLSVTPAPVNSWGFRKTFKPGR